MKRAVPVALSWVALALLAGCLSGIDRPAGVDETNAAPSAALTHSPSSPSVGETVTFDASGSSDPDGVLVEYRWDFEGSGQVVRTTTGPTADHSYPEAGTFEATVTVVDDDGLTDRATTSVDVSG